MKSHFYWCMHGPSPVPEEHKWLSRCNLFFLFHSLHPLLLRMYCMDRAILHLLALLLLLSSPLTYFTCLLFHSCHSNTHRQKEEHIAIFLLFSCKCMPATSSEFTRAHTHTHTLAVHLSRCVVNLPPQCHCLLMKVHEWNIALSLSPRILTHSHLDLYSLFNVKLWTVLAWWCFHSRANVSQCLTRAFHSLHLLHLSPRARCNCLLTCCHLPAATHLSLQFIVYSGVSTWNTLDHIYDCMCACTLVPWRQVHLCHLNAFVAKASLATKRVTRRNVHCWRARKLSLSLFFSPPFSLPLARCPHENRMTFHTAYEYEYC